MVENTGSDGRYTDYKPFTLDVSQKNIGLYLFHGLSPSPQIDLKFTSEDKDPVNVNAFGYSTGLNICYYKYFKCFFTSIVPTINPYSCDTHPNWKVNPILK